MCHRLAPSYRRGLIPLHVPSHSRHQPLAGPANSPASFTSPSPGRRHPWEGFSAPSARLRSPPPSPVNTLL